MSKLAAILTLLAILVLFGLLMAAEPPKDDCNTMACLQERSARLQAQINNLSTQYDAIPRIVQDLAAQKKVTDEQLEKMQGKTK